MTWTRTCDKGYGAVPCGVRRTTYYEAYPVWDPGVADTACVSAGAGHAEPQADRCSGRCGAIQSGQWSSSGQAIRVGRSSRHTFYAIYGSNGGQPVESGVERLLPAITGGRKAEEGGSNCVREEAAYNPKQYGEDGCSLGSDDSQALT